MQKKGRQGIVFCPSANKGSAGYCKRKVEGMELRKLIREISQNSILLPDFQREFTWTGENEQKALVASVLTKLPIGSILLLESASDEYAAHAIGRSEQIIDPQKMDQTVKFLIDGQQRVTVLANVFSNVIYEMEAAYPAKMSLHRRFFLRIPSWKAAYQNQEVDWFHLASLQADNEAKDKLPVFLTGDILEWIECRSFKRGDKTAYNPENAKDIRSLVNFCTAEAEGYRIPLFLMVSSQEAVQKGYPKNSSYYVKTGMKEQIGLEIKAFYEMADLEEQANIRALMGQQELTEQDFDEQLKCLVDEWVDTLFAYVDSCLEKLELNEITVQADTKARAIDIYEQLNMGGESLKAFDLVVAKASVHSRENLLDQIKLCMEQERTYEMQLLSRESKPYVPQELADKSATIWMKQADEKSFQNTYLDAFLNVLGLYCNNEQFAAERVSLQHTKRKEILKLQSKQIVENYEVVCEGLDRACFFLKVRCGLRTLADLHYKLMFTVLGYLFMKEAFFVQEKVHNCLEAWYWCSIFSGAYDKDQNRVMENDIKQLIQTFKGSENSRFDWLVNRKKAMFAQPDFCEEGFLLLESCGNGGLPPKQQMRYLISQYYLSKTYSYLFEEKTMHNFDEAAKNFEVHHIIPLGSTGENPKKIRKDPTHILNSPLNFMYIEPDEHHFIKEKNIREYCSKIRLDAYQNLALEYFKELPETQYLTKSDVKECLRKRFCALRGQVESEVREMLRSGGRQEN